MKTLPEINALIAAETDSFNALPNKSKSDLTLFDAPQKDLKKREASKRIATLEFLQMCRNYLETNPTEAYLQNQVTSLRTRIANLSQITVPVTFYPDNFTGDKAAYFNKKMGIVEMREQIKSLEFILWI